MQAVLPTTREEGIMPLLMFFLFTLVMGLLMHMAFKRGEVKFKCTKDELEKLASRGRLIHFISWPFVGFAIVAMIDWASGGIPDRNFSVIFVVFMIAAGVPAGLFAWAVNEFLERTKYRIQRSVPR